MTSATTSVDRDAAAAARRRAAAMIVDGNALVKQGRIAEAMARYDAAIQADSRYAPAYMSRGNVLQTSGQLEGARSAYQQAIACDPQYAEAHFNLATLCYRAGQFAHALHGYQTAASIKPQFADAFVGMANAFVALDRVTEAMASYQHALTINPRLAEAHFNLGVLAASRQRPHEALASLRSALALRPDYAAAHRTLSAVLTSLGDLDAAETSLRRAFAIEPGSAELLHELAAMLQYRGRYLEALQLLTRALERAPSMTVKVAFATCVARTLFSADDYPVRTALTTALREAWTTPEDLYPSALSLIMLDERIAGCVRVSSELWPARPPRSVLFGDDGTVALTTHRLLHALLEATPVKSISFERFLTCARHALLEIACGEQAPEPADLRALDFYSVLARQCFINEYVFDCSDEERLAASDCRKRLLALLEANAAVPPFLLLAVAAYFPLHLLPGSERLLATDQPGAIREVLRQQVHEPLQERALRAGITRLTPVTDGVSAAVRDQYEQNPYPRWVRVQVQPQPARFNSQLLRLLPFAQFSPLPDDSAPEVLVAGCGTGRDAIVVAQQFLGARVLGVDLSLDSISYGKRKTQELGLSNIEYAQADILKLGEISRTFDVIGAVGVLHHMAEPFAAWRILLSRLRPGGFMCLGLYSQIARRPIAMAREFIAQRGYGSTPQDIRRFRQDVAAGETGAEVQALIKSHAFYSTSDCRDLAFHVHEGNLTLDEIESFLSELGLRFIGFELNLQTLSQYRARFKDDPSSTNLRNWARFEADHPDTFTNMYRFWIQR